MITKTEKAKQAYINKDYKTCYRILKTFKRTITKEENCVIEVAYECFTGNTEFYKSLGYDTNDYLNKALLIVANYFKN